MTRLHLLSCQVQSLLDGIDSNEVRPRPVVGGLACFLQIVPRLVGGLVLGVLLLGGCDASVEPTVSSDQYRYSMYGILNPAQDTQWVRVEPLAEPTSAGAPEELDVTVTLKNVDTGQTWGLRDSLTEVFRDEFQHNFWTTAPITASTSYQLTVQNAEGETTSASTTTPAGPPSIDVRGSIALPCTSPRGANQFEVVVKEVEELAALRMEYYQSVLGPTEIFDFDHYDDVEETDNGYRAVVNYFQDLQSARRNPQRSCLADSAKVIAAAGGPDWPEWGRYSQATISQIARPDSFTNVDGGHGIVAGVYLDTTRVPIDRDAR